MQKKSNNGLCSLQIRHSLFLISLLVNGRKKGIEYKKSIMLSRDLSHQLLFGPDQQYSRPARLVSCIGINVLHNQNIHFDKRNQIAEIWNYSYHNVVHLQCTPPPLSTPSWWQCVQCTLYSSPKDTWNIYMYACPLHIPCSLLADDSGIQDFKCFDRARVQDSKYPMRERQKLLTWVLFSLL